MQALGERDVAERMVIAVQAQRQRPLHALIAACGVWAAVAAVRLALHWPAGGGIAAVIDALAGLAPPLVTALFAASLLPRSAREIDADGIETRVEAAAGAAATLEVQLAATAERLTGLAELARTQTQASLASGRELAQAATLLADGAARAEASGTGLRAAATDLLAVAPQFSTQAAALDASLRQIASTGGEQIRAAETLLASLRTRAGTAASEGDAAIAAMVAMLNRIDETSANTTAAIAKRAYALDAAVDGAMARSTGLLDTLAATLQARAAALNDTIAASAAQLEDLGGSGAQVLAQRLDTLLAAAGQLGRQFAEHETLATTTAAAIAGQLDALEARLAQVHAGGIALGDDLRRSAEQHAGFLGRTLTDVHAQSRALTDELGTRTQALAEALVGLGAPAGTAQAALERLDAQARTVKDGVGGLDAAMAAMLNGALEGFEVLGQRAAALHDGVAALRGVVDEGGAEVGRAADRFAAERTQVIQLAGDIASRLDDARAALAEIGENAGRSADTATSALTAALDRAQAAAATVADQIGNRLAGATATASDALARLEPAAELVAAGIGRHVGDVTTAASQALERLEPATAAAAGRMQGLLTTVVADAEAALDRAGARTSEAAFGAPIRNQIAALDETAARAADTAQRAAERTTRQLVALVETVADVERRIDAADVRFDVRGRDTLTARSAQLMAQLNNASIDVAKLIGADTTEATWSAYLAGDRSVFTRAVARAFDRDGTRRIARLYKHDEAFREEASRYVELFEGLVRRVVDDPDGEDFAAALLTADVGKLYVAVARALGRAIPTRAQPTG